jgi:hypothetical protein
MSLTTKNQLLIAFKKLVGKSHTNSQFGSANESIGSNVQIDNATIFSQPIPSSPSSSLYSVTNNIVEKVQFSLVSIPSSQYTAVGAAGGGITTDGDGAPSQGTFTNGIHAYALVLPSNYQTLSSNPKKGTGVFINNQSLTASNGLLQIVPERYGALYPASVSSSTGIIAPLEEEDYLLDPYSGILFLQDINRVPTSVTAYVYIGDYLTERVSSSLGQFTTITGSNVTGTLARFTTISSSNLIVSGGSAVFYEQAVLGDNAYILYNASIDKLAAFPGLYVTGAITASTLVNAPTGSFTTVSASVVSASSYIGLSGSIVAGGTNTTVQFNSGSTFSGSTNFVWDYTNNRLGVGTSTPGTSIPGTNINLDVSSNGDTKILARTTNLAGYSAFVLQSTAHTNTPYMEFQLIPSNTDKESYVRYNYNAPGGSSTNDILVIRGNGRVGIGKTTPNATLDVSGSTIISGNLNVTGTLTATTKSFDIVHPLNSNMRLRYGSLEGPENGVYVRGKTKEKTIQLPEYWTNLVDETTITVNLTPIGSHQQLWVEKVENNTVVIGGELVECYFTVFAERKDVDKLVVEY